MGLHYWWWLLALGLAVAELFTGTFYLLIIALGCAAAGVAALLDASITVQVITAAAVTVLGWLALKMSGISKRSVLSADRDPDVMLDVGGQVQIDQWDSHRQTRVSYRGAQWSVELARDTTQAGAPGAHRIVQVRGNTLIVAPVAPIAAA